MSSVSVIILTFNEELHLRRAIGSVQKLAAKIFVVDSFSTDRTVEIASDCGAIVVQHPFENQARQFNWALQNLAIDSEWILRLDADEVIDEDLADEISGELPNVPSSVTGVQFSRKHIFMGRWIRHGGRYPMYLLRLWRRGIGKVEDRWMDEHVVLHYGDVVTFRGGFRDHNLHDLSYFIAKHNGYATREAVEVILAKRFPQVPDKLMVTGQAKLKRLLKEKLYNQISFPIAAFAYFVWRYVFRLGFLDGTPGLIYHLLQGYWYRFLVGAKVYEFEKATAECQSEFELIAELSRLSGCRLESRV